MKTVSMLQFRRDARRALDAVRRGEPVLLTYRGKAVARLEPVRGEMTEIGPDDALWRIDEYAVDGPGGQVSNEEIDRFAYGD
jgi:antitoxin (DNA-binding transcriptional repressor) of toxin-antitoxin stability system